MPKDTFLNLPKEKQDIIYKAAIKEFSRVPFTEASINQIIQNANISRGSFYMYFEDKEDLYNYLLIAHRKKLEEKFIKVLEENHGDIIDTYLALFNMVATKLQKRTGPPFFKRVIMNTRLHDKALLENGYHEKIPSRVFRLFDRKKLNVKDDKEFCEVIDMIDLVFIQALMRVTKCNMNVEDGYEMLKRQLTVLKEGLYCKEEKND